MFEVDFGGGDWNELSKVWELAIGKIVGLDFGEEWCAFAIFDVLFLEK